MPVQFFRAILEIFRMIKLSHSLLALPFAFMGAILAARGLPEARTLAYIFVAMVGARSAAMAFNRLVDEPFDGLNPRTAQRSLPQGRVSRGATAAFIIASSLTFIWAAAQLNRTCLMLSPLALVVILGYSLSKHFTWSTHLILGLSLALAPAGSWLAVRGDLGLPVVILSVSVLFWVAGFDILYALQDEEFDRRLGLRSLPATIGRQGACRGAAGCHMLAALGFGLTGWLAGLGRLYVTAAIVSALILLIQHLYIAFKEREFFPPAFFTLNSLLGFVLSLAAWLSLKGANLP